MKRDARGRFVGSQCYCTVCRIITAHHRCRTGICIHCDICGNAPVSDPRKA